jgi:DNA-nicking Smr family endonuclease
MADNDTPENMEEPIHMPIGDAIDLHHFRPSEVADLVNEYLIAAQEKGFREVRIIHGKGMSKLKNTVLAVLERHPLVLHFGNAPDHRGGWGATIVALRDAPSEH